MHYHQTTLLGKLGVLEHHNSWNFLEIALLGCFCAIHNHGFELLFSFLAIVQHTPCPPFGFSILRDGLNKSVLLSVYVSPNTSFCYDNQRLIASFFSGISFHGDTQQYIV
ncbi:hypothetical protein V6Z12_A05G408300 [Gossypium hirsutum]